MAVATLASLFTAYLVHTDLFHPSNRLWLIPVLPASLFALFTAFRVIDDLCWAGFALTLAAALAIAAIAWPEVAPKLQKGMTTPGGLLDAGSPARWTVLALACAGPALALYLLHKGLPAHRWGAIALLATASILATLLIALGLKFGEGGSGYHADGWEDHPKLRPVEFRETPNLCFVGFDSITPEAIMRKHMGIQTTDFHR